jgi:hypothetical protein
MKLKTVAAAKKEISELQAFVALVESYEVSTLKQRVLKEYAYLGSIIKVVERVNKELGRDTIDNAFVSQLLRSKSQDELHKILKSNYLLKTRPARRRQKQYLW